MTASESPSLPQRDELRAILDAHLPVFESDGDYGERQWVECSCGSDYFVDTDAGYSEHRAHVADLLAARRDDLAERVALGQVCNQFSALLDGTYPADLDAEAHRWRRLAKIGEEYGEVVEALLGSVAENPRKGASHDLNDVRKELLDVAFCALAAHAHLDGNEGDVLARLTLHAESTHNRLRAALTSDRAATEGGGERG